MGKTKSKDDKLFTAFQCEFNRRFQRHDGMFSHADFAFALFKEKKSKMTKKALLIERLKEIDDASCGVIDAEIAHGQADDAILEFINDKDISEAYNKIEKWHA